MKNSLFFLFSFLIIFANSKAQVISDTTFINSENKYPETIEGISFSAKQLIIPAALITVGTIGALDKGLDKDIRDELARKNPNTAVDNILPFVAPTSVYVLNWCGIEGKHNFIDRSVIFGTSSALTIGSVFLLKYATSRTRPDGRGNDSFPSMHTAVSFMGAEFLRQEFKDQSVWYGVVGYGIATATGFLRIYNNKHWLSDVLVGAGVGILGTKAAYWLYPEIRKLYEGTFLDNAMIVPYASSGSLGFSLSAEF